MAEWWKNVTKNHPTCSPDVYLHSLPPTHPSTEHFCGLQIYLKSPLLKNQTFSWRTQTFCVDFRSRLPQTPCPSRIRPPHGELSNLCNLQISLPQITHISQLKKGTSCEELLEDFSFIPECYRLVISFTPVRSVYRKFALYFSALKGIVWYVSLTARYILQ